MSYHSKYTSPTKNLSASQKIAEIMCERLASKNKQTLAFKFWNTKEWKQFFIHQLLLANKLLKKYPPQVIMKTLRDKRIQNIYSLNMKSLIPLFNHELKNFERQSYNDDEDINAKNLEILNRPNFNIQQLPKDL